MTSLVEVIGWSESLHSLRPLWHVIGPPWSMGCSAVCWSMECVSGCILATEGGGNAVQPYFRLIAEAGPAQPWGSAVERGPAPAPDASSCAVRSHNGPSGPGARALCGVGGGGGVRPRAIAPVSVPLARIVPEHNASLCAANKRNGQSRLSGWRGRSA